MEVSVPIIKMIQGEADKSCSHDIVVNCSHCQYMFITYGMNNSIQDKRLTEPAAMNREILDNRRKMCWFLR